MRKMLLFFLALMPVLFISCGDSEGSNETRAGIIAENMVRADVLSANDLEFDLIGVDKESNNEYHAVANIKTLNGLGVKVPRKVSVRLRYNGTGDWSDMNNWTKISISYLDEATGRTQSAIIQDDVQSAKRSKNPFSGLKGGEEITIADVVFTVKASDDDNLLIVSAIKLPPDKIKIICKEVDVHYIAFYYDIQTPGEDDPYSMKMDDIIFYDDDII